MTSSNMVALVTGANKGIGFGIVRALCKEIGRSGVVYLASRTEEHGQKAVQDLNAEGLDPKFLQLDICNSDHVVTVSRFLQDTHGGLDILVNNAGIAFKKSATEPNSIQAPVTIETNVFATIRLSRALIPLIRSNGRVVNVACHQGSVAYSQISPELQSKFKEVETEQGVVDLMNEFISAAKEEKQKEHGWCSSNYAVSKLGRIALTRVQAREVSKDSSREDVLINSCCPGRVRTDMSSHNGNLSIDEGAVQPVYLALLPPGSQHNGTFHVDKKVLDFW